MFTARTITTSTVGDGGAEWPVVDDEDLLVDEHAQHLRAIAAKDGRRYERSRRQREHQRAANGEPWQAEWNRDPAEDPPRRCAQRARGVLDARVNTPQATKPAATPS